MSLRTPEVRNISNNIHLTDTAWNIVTLKDS